LEQIATLFEMSVVQLLTFNDSEQQEKYTSEVETLTKRLQEREMEVLDLQKKVIELYEELRVHNAQHSKRAS
jgi:predicted  nucleic acid-binding Zn-ribbon protein